MAAATGELDTKKAANQLSYQMSSGVKALAESRVIKIPEIFHRPADDLATHCEGNGDSSELPLIDLEGVHGEGRRAVVEEIRKASEEWGFFQIVNHGIPQRVLDEMILGVRRFHEQTEEAKLKVATQDTSGRVIYRGGADANSFESKAVWRDSLFCYLTEFDFPTIPFLCREILVEYIGWIVKLKNLLSELFSEALGLNRDYLNLTECTDSLAWSGYYYPACPESHMTIGIDPHKDISMITILLQDEIGGLQVLHQNLWKDAIPIKGALVVNIGDFLQVMSNDKFKSVMHRVLAKPVGPRMSVPVFIHPKEKDAEVIGPIKELLSENDPPVYRKFSHAEYLNVKSGDFKSGLPYFKH